MFLPEERRVKRLSVGMSLLSLRGGKEVSVAGLAGWGREQHVCSRVEGSQGRVIMCWLWFPVCLLSQGTPRKYFSCSQ